MKRNRIGQNIFIFLFLNILWFGVGCQSKVAPRYPKLKKNNEVTYPITRLEQDHLYPTPISTPQIRENYPWEQTKESIYPKITKEFFRCKGSVLHTPKIIKGEKQSRYLVDCQGSSQHSLPLTDGEERVYPILIDLLNYLQKRTGKKVKITSGHQCPLHYSYIHPERRSQVSKHLIGAEVDFYVEGFEWKPLEIVQMIQEYYTSESKYQGQVEYQVFRRYVHKDTTTSQLPWYNKEILIKVYKETEGRDDDNCHPYPYLSIQVRFDIQKQKKVVFNWHQAFNGYKRR